MSSGLLSIGSTALDAAYTALRTTGNNIANVNTPGYSREITTFTPQVSTGLTNMYVGTGVAVQSVTRMYTDFLGQQTNLAQSQASAADMAAQLTGQVNGLFANAATGLGTAMDNFFTQLQSLTNQPGNAANRQAVLSAAQQMTGQFNNFASQLQQMDTSSQQQMGQEISTVNTTVSQIAQLNNQIALAVASGGSPNTLLDQRDQALLTLNQSLGVTSQQQANGDINIYLANGQPLLVGSQTFTLAMGKDPVNPQLVDVGTTNGGAAIAALDPNSSGGGKIGALLQFQNQTLPSVRDQIGRLAVTLSNQMNALQAQGVDLNNLTGTNFFTTPTIGVATANSNADIGTFTLNASYGDVTKLQASDYQLSVGSGNSYTLTRLSDGSKMTLYAITSGSNTVLSTNASTATLVDGMNLSFTGTAPKPGDLFTIQPVAQGAANIGVAITQGSQIAAASPLQASVPSTNNGSLAVASLNLLAPSVPVSANSNLLTATSIKFTSPTTYVTYPTASPTSTSAPQSYVSGQTISLNGWSLTLSGTAANGDVVNVAPGVTGSGDNRNALQMVQLQSLGIVSGQTLDSASSAVIATVGALASNAATDQTSKDAILQSASSAESSVSGVNLDEEASKLLQYQQQYQAAAKIIQTANNVFDAILAVAAAA